MSNYPTKEKNIKTVLIAIIFVLAIICAVSLTLIFTGNTNSNRKTKTKIIRKDPQVEKSNTSEINEESPKEDNSIKTIPHEINPPSKAYDTVEEYITQYLRPMCNGVYERRNTLTNERIATDTTAYYRSDGTLALVISADPRATTPWEYRYYFDENGEPIFIFDKNGSAEYRYYYRDGVLVRYINPHKVTTDYPTDIDICNVGQQFFDHAKKYR